MYYWRRRVPAEIQDRLPRRSLVVSLQTTAHDAARERATAFSAAFDRLVRAMERRPVPEGEVLPVLRQAVRALLSAEPDRAAKGLEVDGELGCGGATQDEAVVMAPRARRVNMQGHGIRARVRSRTLHQSKNWSLINCRVSSLSEVVRKWRKWRKKGVEQFRRTLIQSSQFLQMKSRWRNGPRRRGSSQSSPHGCSGS